MALCWGLFCHVVNGRLTEVKQESNAAGGNPVPQCPSGSLSVCLILHALMTPPKSTAGFPMGPRVSVWLPSVAFPAYDQTLATQTPEAMRPPHQNPNTQTYPQPPGHRSILLICVSKDLRMPCSLTRTPWPKASVSLAGDNCERTQSEWGESPLPW